MELKGMPGRGMAKEGTLNMTLKWLDLNII
jgi:hypothetical protein